MSEENNNEELRPTKMRGVAFPKAKYGVILAVVITTSFFIIRNLILRNERLEDFITKQSEAIEACDKRLKQITSIKSFFIKNKNKKTPLKRGL